MSKLLDIFELAEEKGRSVRELRGLVAARKIPFYRLGHRSLRFDLKKVEAALQRFEIPAVNNK